MYISIKNHNTQAGYDKSLKTLFNRMANSSFSNSAVWEAIKAHNNTIIKSNFWIILVILFTKSLKIISDFQKYIIEMTELDPWLKFWKSAICNNFTIQNYPLYDNFYLQT